MNTKTYANKSDAVRAFKKQGIESPTVVQNDEGRWGLKIERAAKGEQGVKIAAARTALEKGVTFKGLCDMNEWAPHTARNFLSTVVNVDGVPLERTGRGDERFYKVKAAQAA